MSRAPVSPSTTTPTTPRAVTRAVTPRRLLAAALLALPLPVSLATAGREGVDAFPLVVGTVLVLALLGAALLAFERDTAEARGARLLGILGAALAGIGLLAVAAVAFAGPALPDGTFALAAWALVLIVPALAVLAAAVAFLALTARLAGRSAQPNAGLRPARDPAVGRP